MFGGRYVRVSYLLDLVMGLPAASISMLTHHDQPLDTWSETDKLLALTVEGLDTLAVLFAKANAKDKHAASKVPHPVRIPWPGRRIAGVPSRVVLNRTDPATVRQLAGSVTHGRIKHVPRKDAG